MATTIETRGNASFNGYWTSGYTGDAKAGKTFTVSFYLSKEIPVGASIITSGDFKSNIYITNYKCYGKNNKVWLNFYPYGSTSGGYFETAAINYYESSNPIDTSEKIGLEYFDDIITGWSGTRSMTVEVGCESSTVNAFNIRTGFEFRGDIFYTTSTIIQDGNFPNIYFSNTSPEPGSSVILSWSTSSVNNNPLTGYIVKKNGVQIYSGTNTSYNIIAGTDGVSDTYEVIASYTYGESKTSTAILTAKASYGNLSTPTNLNFNGLTAYYIGSDINNNQLQLNWSASGGTNNPVKYYQLYQNGLATSITTTNLSLSLTRPTSTTAYQVKAIGTYSDSSLSENASVYVIGQPSSITVSTNSSSPVNSSVVYSWAADTSGGAYTTSYNLQYRQASTSSDVLSASWSSNIIVNTNQYSLPITNITSGNWFQIRVQAVRTIQSNVGNGTSTGTWVNSEILQKITQLSIPSLDTFLVSIYDTKADNGFNSGKKNLGYSIINITCSTISSTNDNTIYYKLQYQLPNENWQNVSDFTTSTSFTHNITSIPENTTYSYKFVVMDSYNNYTESESFFFTKIKVPSLTNVSITDCNISKLYYTFTNENFSGDGVNYNATLIYNGITRVVGTGSLTGVGITEKVLNTDISLSASNTDSFFQTLYTKVITNGYTRPAGKLVLSSYVTGFPLAKKEVAIDFNFNYLVPITNLSTDSLKISYPSGREVANLIPSYYNPGETVTLSFTAPEWKNAANETIAQINNNYCPVYTLTTGTKIIGTFNNSTSLIDTIVALSKYDSQLEYILTGTINYSDAISSSSIKVSANIARFYNDSITVSSLTRSKIDDTQDLIKGNIIIPKGAGGSSLYHNLTKVVIKGNNSNTVPVVIKTYDINSTTNNQWPTNYYDENQSISFEFITPNTDDTFYLTAEYINTNSDSTKNKLVYETTHYMISGSNIDVAIRKGKVGINVGKNFISKDGDPTVVINAGAQTGSNPIIDIQTTNTSSDDFPTIYFKLSDGGSQSNIYSDGEYILIDNLLAKNLANDNKTTQLSIENDGSAKLVTTTGVSSNSSIILTSDNYNNYISSSRGIASSGPHYFIFDSDPLLVADSQSYVVTVQFLDQSIISGKETLNYIIPQLYPETNDCTFSVTQSNSNNSFIININSKTDTGNGAFKLIIEDHQKIIENLILQ